MENSTPLTRCDTCHTVFEVPNTILESVDSRVRCGECLQVFDASINLHNANRPDFSLIDDTLVEGGADSATAESTEIKEAATIGGAAVALAGSAEISGEIRGEAPVEVTRGVTSGVADRETNNDATDENHLEATMSDFDLFSDDASLPEVSYEFGENTIDAIRLRFDEVEDIPDETLSDSLFPNDVTIDASGLGASTGVAGVAAARNLAGPASDRISESTPDRSVSKSASDAEATPLDDVLRKSAKTGFVVAEGRKPETVEFDFSENAPVSEADPGNSAVAPGAGVAATGQGVRSSAAVATATQTNAAGSSQRSAPRLTQAQPDHGQSTHVDTGIDSQPSQGKRRGGYLVPVMLMLLTAALIAALYGYRERNNLADNSLTRPVYLAWCALTGCSVPARFDKTRLKVVEKNIFSHPTLDDALVITVLLENNADFEQRYPALFVWLSDSGRRTVAENQFEAAVYLPENGLALDSVMAPGQRQQISIDVRDPGRRAVSLELNLR